MNSQGNISGSGMAALAALCLLAPACARAAEVAAVLSSDAAPYAEAYAAFKAAVDSPVDVYNASSPDFSPPEDAAYTVAFGAKAAAAEYPAGVHHVYLLAPLPRLGQGWHQVSMAPEPAAALAAYKALQPGLKRLAVFWSAYPGEDYISDLQKAGESFGVEIISARLKSPDSFPDRLRRLIGRMDAFWLMPDPALITPGSLMVLASFSCANAIPFYAPTQALLQSGASASLAPDFAQAGAAAAAAVNAIRRGRKLPRVTFVEDSQLKVNGELAEKCRWPLKR